MLERMSNLYLTSNKTHEHIHRVFSSDIHDPIIKRYGLCPAFVNLLLGKTPRRIFVSVSLVPKRGYIGLQIVSNTRWNFLDKKFKNNLMGDNGMYNDALTVIKNFKKQFPFNVYVKITT